MIKKSLCVLLLSYIFVVFVSAFLAILFQQETPPSDSYTTYSDELGEKFGLGIAFVIILSLIVLRKKIIYIFKIKEELFFHFILYMSFFYIVSLFTVFNKQKSTLYYDITGARKVKDSIYGYQYPANGKRHELVYFHDSLLLDVTYTFDSLRRRVTPQHTVSKNKSILFFGCSFTYGDGVSDTETLPAKYALLDTSKGVYNYAIDGWGPQQTLQLLRHRNLTVETQTDTALGIYVWIDDHAKRVAMYRSHYVGWIQYFPCFLLEKDSLIYMGIFEKKFPVKTLAYQILQASYFFNGIDFPINETTESYELSCAILKASQVAFKEQFKAGKFVVLLYSGQGKWLIPYLKKKEIDYIITDNAGIKETDYIPIHGHPNKNANRKLSYYLYKKLQERSL